MSKLEKWLDGKERIVKRYGVLDEERSLALTAKLREAVGALKPIPLTHMDGEGCPLCLQVVRLGKEVIDHKSDCAAQKFLEG